MRIQRNGPTTWREVSRLMQHVLASYALTA